MKTYWQPSNVSIGTDPAESLWNALTTKRTQAIVEELRTANAFGLTDAELRERLRHERDDEPRGRSFEEIMEDATGIPARGEI